MPKATILFADNAPDFLRTRAEFLEQEGYRVMAAADPTEARKLLERGGIDLAILDVRLQHDDDEKDTSGLTLAKEVAHTVPKIILTGFPTVDSVREALRSQFDGLPAAVDFVAKQEGPEAMLRMVDRALRQREAKPMSHELSLEERLTPVSFSIVAQLKMDYEEVRKEVIFTHRARLALTIAGVLVILGGGIAALLGNVAIGTLSAISGIVAELLAALFTRFAADANRRMDQYHKELVIFYKKEKEVH